MITLYNNLPTLDLHGVDRDYARILINEFIDDNYKLGNKYIAIVHGKGEGVLKKRVHELLKTNKKVEVQILGFYFF